MIWLWVVLPVGFALTLAVALLARARPSFAPLVGPIALSTLALGAWVLVLEGRLAASSGVLLVILAPLLIFFVRTAVVAFQAVFRRRRGVAPPRRLEGVIAVLLYLLGAAVVAYRWFGVELALLLVAAAVLGSVLGLALQDSLRDLFAGIALQVEAPFEVGDWVRVGGRDGKVDRVCWRSTRLRTADGHVFSVPNRALAGRAVLNYSQPAGPHARVLHLTLSYHTPPSKVFSVLQGVLPQVSGLASDPAPAIRIAGQEDLALRYEVRYWVASYEDHARVEGEIFRLAWYHFRRHGVDAPTPAPARTANPGAADAPEDAGSPTSRLRRALVAVDLFRPLTEDERRAAAARFRSVHYAGGEKIIEEGAPGDSFFLIDRGEVQVSKKMGGFSRELARLGDGQFFGEMALATGEPRAATVVAASDVDLFVLDKNGFQDIIAANPAMAVDISSVLAERREALSQAEGDVTHRFDVQGNPTELKARILDRIRVHFGV